jgi:peptide/nickel transport system substrate-binding protein
MNPKLMSRRQALRAAIVATAGVGAAAALAACGEEKVVEKVVTKTVEVEKIVVKEVPVEVVVPGGAEQQVLRFGTSAEMGSLDNQADPNSEPSRAVIANILENLTRYGYKATSKGTRTKDHDSVVPWLAEGYEIADDAKSITYRLRKGITFGDGTPLTAQDVAYSMERSLTIPGIPAFILGVIGNFTAEAKPEVIDDFTVKMNLNPGANSFTILSATEMGPYAPIMNSTALQAHATGSDPWAQEWAATVEGAASIGTGPWIVEEFESTRFLLRGRQDYWGGSDYSARPAVGAIEGTVITDATQRALLLREGAIDMTEQLLLKDLKEFDDDSAFTVHHAPGSEHHYLALNMSEPPFDDLRVRQAINHALPRQQLVDQLTFGFARAAEGPVPSICFGYQPYYQQYEYNLDKASQLIKDAGHGDGLSFTVRQDESSAIQGQALQVLAGELSKINVNMEIQRLSSAAVLEGCDLREDGTQQAQCVAATMNWPPLIFDAAYFMIFGYKSDSRSNWSRWGTSETDDLITAAVAELDASSKFDRVAEIQQRIADQAPRVPFLDVDSHVVSRKGVEDVRIMDVWPRFEDIRVRS